MDFLCHRSIPNSFCENIPTHVAKEKDYAFLVLTVGIVNCVIDTNDLILRSGIIHICRNLTLYETIKSDLLAVCVCVS